MSYKPSAEDLKKRFPNGPATVEQIKNVYLRPENGSLRTTAAALEKVGLQSSPSKIGDIVAYWKEHGEWPAKRPPKPSKAKVKSTLPKPEKVTELASPIVMAAPLGNDPKDETVVAGLGPIAAKLESDRQALMQQGGGELETTYKKELLAFSTLLVRVGASRVNELLDAPSEAGALLKNCADVADKVRMVSAGAKGGELHGSGEAQPVAASPEQAAANETVDFLTAFQKKHGLAPSSVK